MLVGRRMKRDPVTIGPEEGLRAAAQLIKEKKIRHLPVMEGGKLVGIICDRDIRQAWASSATSLEVRELYYLLDKIKVGSIMTRKVITVTPATTIEEAALLLHDNKIGCLPVLDQEELVGIITETDIFAILVELMGLASDTSRIEVFLEDRPGTLAQLAHVASSQGINIASLVTYHSPEPLKGVAVLRVKMADPASLVKAISEAGYEVLSVMPAKQH